MNNETLREAGHPTALCTRVKRLFGVSAVAGMDPDLIARSRTAGRVRAEVNHNGLRGGARTVRGGNSGGDSRQRRCGLRWDVERPGICTGRPDRTDQVDVQERLKLEVAHPRGDPG